MKRDIECWSYGFLLAAAFFSGFTMPVARGFLAICLILLLIHLFASRKVLVLSASFWFWLAFFLVAVFSTAFGVSPEVGFKKMEKLVWFLAIPLCVNLVTSVRRLSFVLAAYALGTGVAALRTIIIHPIHASRMVKSGKIPDFMPALINEGSMTYAQVLMLGILIVIGFIFICRHENRSAFKWWILLIFQSAAMIMMFKRGSWVCVILLAAVFMAANTKWRYLLILGAVILAAFALPPVRARMANIRNEFNMDSGGRMTMWFKIAPELFKEYPLMGRGYKFLTNDMMRKISRNVERDRNHLHSNIAQILVDMGVIGLAVYLFWMLKAMFDASRLAQLARRTSSVESILGTVLLLMTAGLFMNGLVEYNFGDGEIILAYGLVLGCIGAMRNLVSQPSTTPASS